MNDSLERKYNFIFEKLASEPDDLVGLLAYGIYKREKITYITNFQTEHGRGPTEGELSVFHEMSCSHLGSYLRQAEIDLADLQNLIAEEAVSSLSKEYDARFKDELRKMRPSWRAAITQSFLGSVIFTFFVGALVVIILGWRYGINTIIQEGVKMLTGQ